MEEKLIQRLESAGSRLEALSSCGGGSLESYENAASEASILAFEDLMRSYLRKVLDAGEKIGGQVLEATRIVEEAFAAEKELLVKVKQTQKPDLAGLAEFLKPLNEVILKANTLTAGKISEFFNHLKTVADALLALAWIAYTGKGCGMSMPIAHVEENWQTAEFYCNKILVEFKSKDQNHVEWAKALKELFLPGLKDYVKCFYPLGPVWNPAGKMSTPPATSTKIPAPSASAPPPPSAPLFSTETSKASARPKEGMAAVFQEISSGKSVTEGLRKVTDDMKTKNRAERTGMVNASDDKAKKTHFDHHHSMKKVITGTRESDKESYLFLRNLSGTETELERKLFGGSHIIHRIPPNGIPACFLSIGSWNSSSQKEGEFLWLIVESKARKLAWETITVGNEAGEDRPSHHRMEFNVSDVERFEVKDEEGKIRISIELRESPSFFRGLRSIRGIRWLATNDFTQVGIADAIHRHGPHPMPLSQLVSALQLNPSKTQLVYRLMR